jgi:hypothetical protein
LAPVAVTVGELIRQRQAEVRERFDAMVDLVESGEATHYALDPLLDEAEFLAALAGERLAELEALHPGDGSD